MFEVCEEMVAFLMEKYGCTREAAVRTLTTDERALDEENERNADRQFAEPDWDSDY